MKTIEERAKKVVDDFVLSGRGQGKIYLEEWTKTLHGLVTKAMEEAAEEATKAERARCVIMLTRCQNVYGRNNPPRIERHEAFAKQTAIEYALMVVAEWSLTDSYSDDLMPLPY